MQETSTAMTTEGSTVASVFDIQLIGDDVERLKSEAGIELSSGIVPAGRQYDSHPYWTGAFVPKLPWRMPSNSELDLLFASAETVQPGKWIQIIRIPEEIVGLFEDARIASKNPVDRQLRDYIAGSECREAIRNTVEYASTLTWP